MIRHDADLWKRKPKVVQHCTHVLTGVKHAKLPPDEHPDEDGGLTGSLTTHDKWPCLDHLDQAFLLRRCQLRAATTTVAVGQAVHAAQQEGLTPPLDTGRTQAPWFAEHLHGSVGDQQGEQHRGAPYQPQSIALIGVLQTALQLFDSRTTELYSDAHGCLLLVSCLAWVLGELLPCAHEN